MSDYLPFTPEQQQCAAAHFLYSAATMQRAAIHLSGSPDPETAVLAPLAFQKAAESYHEAALLDPTLFPQK